MTLCASAELCMKALLGLELYPLDSAALERVPHPSAQSSLEKTITCHSKWKREREREREERERERERESEGVWSPWMW